MLTLYDYLPSRNAWKVRQLLRHLDRPYRSVPVSIFEGEGQRPDYLQISPTGTVPALRFEDGRVLSESNPILFHLAEGTPYLPADGFDRAKVLQWMSFEQERVESQIGALRHWTQTGKLARRAPVLVEGKRAAGRKALAVLDAQLAGRPFVAGQAYTVADIALFAYASRSDEADGLSLAPFAHLRAWIARVRAQPGFLDEDHPYALDPHSGRELP
ncbi:glutathione S-transferase family protein [Luteimonas aquatica]|uniref:glutathione S-transferase family protein n=1 Tax=Luteimonas aquatica TaxID=450364 RepID=UPI001F599C81|nr:glutathione S-transferase family protein [Luteimonas aquatica]